MIEEYALLENIGLTKSEIKVYLSLIELGSSSKGPIVERSGVASSKVYELLEKLMKKGLVGYVSRGGVRYFEAASPSRIMDYVHEKKASLEKQENALEQLIPKLEDRRSMENVGSETEVFKGMKGAETSFGNILRELKKGDEYFVLGISKFTDRFERFVIKFHKKRAQAGIKCKIVVNELAKETGKKLAAIPLTRVRYLSKELFTPVVFIPYKDKTLISIGLDEIFIQVTSKNLSQGLKAYAEYMWKIGKK